MRKNAQSASGSRARRIIGGISAGALVLGMVVVGATFADSGSGDGNMVSQPSDKRSKEGVVRAGPTGKRSKEGVVVAAPTGKRSKEGAPTRS